MANAFRVWHRVIRVEDALHATVRTEEYKVWEAALKGEDKEKAAQIQAHINNADAWTDAKALVAALNPVYKLLRLVDGFTPTVGKIYYKCLRVQELFEELAEQEDAPEWAGELLRFWVADWGYLHCDLHSIGYLLDPEYHAHSKDCTKEVWDEFVRGATRMLKAAPPELGLSAAKLTLEYNRYRNKRGIYTTDVIAAAKDGPAHEWWQQWGKGEPTLRWVAMRALAQTTSASCSEQGWSEYDYIHSRRRNRLGVQLASDLTKGHNMARLLCRFKKSRYEQKFHAHTDSDDPSDYGSDNL